MRPWISALAGSALAWSTAAHADWMEASSPHFVVYADTSEREITRFAEDLELYHHAMEAITGLELPDPSPSNRLTVFVVASEYRVQKLFGRGGAYVGGFYVPRAGDSIAIIPAVHAIDGQQSYSMIALLHEYAHHFLISNSDLPPPHWMAEGAAEFFASAEFPSEGGIKIGMPANQRAGELFYAKDVPVEKLLTPGVYANGASKGFDSFYGKSWLLYHYLAIGGRRPGQLKTYVSLLGKGEDSLQAGRDAFGDLRALDKELDKYLMQKTMNAFVFAPGKLPAGHVAVRALGDGEAEIMPDVIQTRRGVNQELAKAVLEDVHKIAARYPSDPAVLTELAEAECDAGNFDASAAAADAALALDPKRLRAYYQKGRALFAAAEKAPETGKAAAFRNAVQPFLALNRLENDNPLPLIYYFRSFVERNAKPSNDAVLGLTRAAELAPYDLELRLNLAEYQIGAADYADARGNLVPIAYEPHGSPMSTGARTLIERIDSGKPPTEQEASAIMESSMKAAQAEKAGSV